MRGKKVCRIHGGSTPEGIASPNFKHGQRSKYFKHLPGGLAAHFHPDNPNLVQLTEELALLDAGITELLAASQKAKRVSSQSRKALWDLVDRRARLVAVESRRRKDEHEMVASDQFGRFAAAVLAAVAARVPDPKDRAAIQSDVLRVLALSQVPLLMPAAAGGA